MNIDRLYEALNELGEKVKAVVRASMEANGKNNRPKASGKNTLKDSNLYKDLKTETKDVDLIEFMINDYYKYIEYGAKWDSKPPPIKAIIAWCEEKGISTENSIVYAIQMSIWKRGITARPFFESAWEEVDEIWDTFADDIVKILFEEFDFVNIIKES